MSAFNQAKSGARSGRARRGRPDSQARNGRAASDAFGEAGLEPLKLGDSFVDPPCPAAGKIKRKLFASKTAVA
jgi:hypothetical protein